MIQREFVDPAVPFHTHLEILEYPTAKVPHFIDITDDVSEVVHRSGVSHGVVVVFSRHTTAAIKINENEPELLKDMAHFLGAIAPSDREYYHNNFKVRTAHMQDDESPNAHAHCQHLMLSASETVPIVEARLHLGRWQRLFLIELDRPKGRQVSVQALGV